jgi:hypothetical protein
MPESTSKVPDGLGEIVGALPTGGIGSSDRQPSDSDVVQDHVRLRQHQVVTVACLGVAVRSRHVPHAGTTGGGEAVRCSSCGGELSPGGCPSEMISDGCPNANGKVLVKCVGENLLPTDLARSGCRGVPVTLATRSPADGR